MTSDREVNLRPLPVCRSPNPTTPAWAAFSSQKAYRMHELILSTVDQKLGTMKLQPALPQAIACCRDRCSSRFWRLTPHACRVPRFGRCAGQQCGRHFAQLKRDEK